jgi:hypothetical protein
VGPRMTVARLFFFVRGAPPPGRARLPRQPAPRDGRSSKGGGLGDRGGDGRGSGSIGGRFGGRNGCYGGFGDGGRTAEAPGRGRFGSGTNGGGGD